MIRKILMPWDGSVHSQNALKFLISNLGHRSPAEVHVLNVQQQPHVLEHIADGRPSHAVDWLAAEAEAGRKVLQPAVDQLAGADKQHVARVVFGDPSVEVAKYVKTYHCDEVVMGTRGLGAIATLVLGSVAHKVIHLVHVPVTLVK